MRLPHDVRIQDARGGFQRVHGRVDTQLGNLSAEHRGSIQVAERGGGSRVGEVIGRHIDRLHGSNGTFLGRGNAFLHLAHFRGEGGLISHGRGHPAQKGTHFGTRLRETEDVVDEEEDVARTFTRIAVAERFCQGQTAQSHAGTGSRRFVHLSEHHGYLGFFHLFMVHLGQVPLPFFHPLFKCFSVADYAGFNHFAQEVVALAGPFAHAGENGEAVVFLGNVVDEFLDEYGLSHAGTAEQTDLATLQVGFQQVDDLDTRSQDFLRGSQFFKFRRFAVNGQGALLGETTQTVNGLARNIQHAPANLGAHRHGDRRMGIGGFHPPLQSVRGIHRHASDRILPDMLLNLDDEHAAARTGDFQGVVNARKFLLFGAFQIEMDIDHRPDHLGYLTMNCCHSCD